MVATFVIEMTLLVASYMRYRMTTILRLAMSMLFFLAAFQLAEFFVCGGLGVNAATWSRIGYVAITMLPALGLHLIAAIAGYKDRKIVAAGYLLCALWVGLFGFSEAAFTGHSCGGNYVIFQLRSGIGGWYFAYYYGLLFAGIFLAARLAQRARRVKIRQALQGMIVGYFVFLIPTTVVNTLDPSTIDGIPSIMCGFAVLYALILFFYVLPRVSRRR